MVLPFGISSARFIFIKLCRVFIKLWRAKGYRIIMYLDDGIGMHEILEDAIALASVVRIFF